jgi:hypothetical protein
MIVIDRELFRPIKLVSLATGNNIWLEEKWNGRKLERTA